MKRPRGPATAGGGAVLPYAPGRSGPPAASAAPDRNTGGGRIVQSSDGEAAERGPRVLQSCG